MRIVAGKNRGTRLTQVGSGDITSHLRPTSDRVRENIFNLLINGTLNLSLDGVRVLDIFSGSGALGLEALSRGASWVTFIENNKSSIKLIKKNIDLCKVNNLIEIRCADAIKIEKNIDKPFDLIFLDPPYGSGLGEKALKRFFQESWLSKKAIIVLEDNEEIFLEEFESLNSRKYGKTIINILKPFDGQKNS